MLTWWLARAEEQLPASGRWLTDNERRHAGAMRYTKRRADFLLNRWTLKLTVARSLGWADDDGGLARIEARPAPDGAPELFVDGQPTGRGVSLTDRAGCAACLVADQPAAIGCDLELVEPRSDAFVRDYLTGPEASFVTAAGPAHDVSANLIWSAKESALKVLRTGLRRDTRSVEVAHKSTVSEGWREIAITVDGDRIFPGWWQQFGDFVLTVAAEAGAPLPPPRPLVQPPGLAGGSPSHD